MAEKLEQTYRNWLCAVRTAQSKPLDEDIEDALMAAYINWSRALEEYQAGVAGTTGKVLENER